MKKLIFIPILFATACGKSDNRAVVMVQAQAAKAKCVSAKLGDTEVAKCDVPGKDKVVPFIAIYDTALTQPFQVYPLEQQKQEQAPAAPPGAGSGANAPTPPATTPDAGAN